MDKLEILLNKAREFHGEVCPGIALGTRIAKAGIEELGMDPLKQNRNLVVFIEVDRCAADALQAITGCSLGKRTLKFIDYGKFGATFLDMSSGKAVRVSALNKEQQNNNLGKTSDIAGEMMKIPDDGLFTIQTVKVNLPEDDIPGPPISRETCYLCNEDIMHHREVIVNDKVLCRGCAKGTYYTSIDD